MQRNRSLSVSIYFLLIFVQTYFCDLKVSIDSESGNYNLTVNQRLWLRSSYTGLYFNNRWFRSGDGSLSLVESIFRRGNDLLLGEWNETQLIFHFNNRNQSFNMTGAIRQWKTLPAVTFYWNNTSSDIRNEHLLDMDRVSTVFPSFYVEKFSEDDRRAYLTFGGKHLPLSSFLSNDN